MTRGEKLLRAMWILAGVLVMAAILFALAAPSKAIAPLSGSFEPGGGAAFAELLRQSGYDVSVARTVPFGANQNKTVVAFLDESLKLNPTGAIQQRLDYDPEVSSPVAPALTFLRRHLLAGGRSVILTYFDRDSSLEGNPNSGTGPATHGTGNEVTVKDAAGRSYNLVTSGASGSLEPLAKFDGTYTPWKADEGLFGNLESFGPGVAAVIPHADLGINLNVDRGDNARFLLDVLSVVNPSKQPIILLDPAVTGGGAPGVLDVLGSWSKGVLMQAYVFAIVVIFTLGKRFGLAETFRMRQGGTRDLVDGIADVYYRSKAGKAALIQITDAEDRRVRRFLKLPADASRRKRNDQLPDSVVRAFGQAEGAQLHEVRPTDALFYVRSLEGETGRLIGRRAIRKFRPGVESR